jgi:hypothetical protein
VSMMTLRGLFRWDGEVCFLVALGTQDEVS